jgi:hypothetical protein
MALSGSKHPYLTTRIYVVGVALNAYLNRWTSNKLRGADKYVPHMSTFLLSLILPVYRLGPSMRWFVGTLDMLGFAELENGRNAGKYNVDLNPAHDVYTLSPELSASPLAAPSNEIASVDFASLGDTKAPKRRLASLCRRKLEDKRKRGSSYGSNRFLQSASFRRSAGPRKTVRQST